MKKPADTPKKEIIQLVISDKRLVLSNFDGDYCFDLDEVISVEACNGQSCVHLISVNPNEPKIVISESLDAMETILDNRFMRVHRGWIAQLNHVRKYIKADRCLLMKNTEKVPVSKQHIEPLRSAIRKL